MTLTCGVLDHYWRVPGYCFLTLLSATFVCRLQVLLNQTSQQVSVIPILEKPRRREVKGLAQRHTAVELGIQPRNPSLCPEHPRKKDLTRWFPSPATLIIRFITEQNPLLHARDAKLLYSRTTPETVLLISLTPDTNNSQGTNSLLILQAQ